METERKEETASLVALFFKRFGKVVGTILLVLLIGFLLFACIFAAYLRSYLMPQVSFSLSSFNPDETSVVLYQNSDSGEYETLQNLYGDENRIWVSYSDLPKNLINATVAIEDKRFYEHKGVDWYRTLRASVNLFFGSQSTYGASTITQQLVKNLTNDKDVTVRRKLVEIFRALELEREYSKNEILEWYLNTIYLGEQSYGVRTASYTYFGKDVTELDLAECASLIGITNNPSLYDPYLGDSTLANNKNRQENILYQMYDQGYISQAEYQQATGEELLFQRGDNNADDSTYYSYFVDQVIRDVVADLAAKTGDDEDVINTMVLSGGYQIYSTIDMRVQQAAEDIYENLDNIPKTQSTYQQLQSGIVIIDNETGDISAIVGGVGEKTGSLTLSRATQSELSPGSTIKPVAVYAPALENGIITPATVYDDTPFTFGDEAWPVNENGVYSGLTTILESMENSTNTVAVKVLDDVGVDAAYDYAVNQMGLSTLVEDYELNGVSYTDKSYWSLALGGMVRGVTIRDLTAAYAAIENGGVYRKARTYTRVLDSEGNVILDNTQDTRTVMSEKSAYYLTYMMRKTVEEGTGTEAQIDGIEVAGKTGTTSGNKDRWFAGYTPEHTAVVWCGYDNPQEIVLQDDNIDNPAAVLWQDVLSQVTALEPGDTAFDKPGDIVEVDVCRDSGDIPTTWCQQDVRGDETISVELAAEDVPVNSCQVHVETQLCHTNDTLHLASDYCEEQGGTIESYGLLNISRQFPMAGIVVADQQYCVGELQRETGYSEARCDTLDPVNELCPYHTSTAEASGRRNRSNTEDNTAQNDNTDNNDDGEDQPETTDDGETDSQTSATPGEDIAGRLGNFFDFMTNEFFGS